jgi:phenylpyruvate tautomerase PptA (4-oxalocrotonate tautomerase family)
MDLLGIAYPMLKAQLKRLTEEEKRAILEQIHTLTEALLTGDREVTALVLDGLKAPAKVRALLLDELLMGDNDVSVSHE